MCEEQKFLEKNSREVAAACSVSILSAFLEEGNVRSICCNTGELLLDFLKFIVTSVLFCFNLCFSYCAF